jgi:ABC-type phosphate/phosphonate transport system ATPase subunit
VQRYCTRVIGLREGRLVFEGGKDDIAQLSDKRFKEIYGEEAQRLGAR